MATCRIRVQGAEYVGEGDTRLEAFAEAVDRAAPVLREALIRSRGRRTQERLLARRSAGRSWLVSGAAR